MVKFIQFALYLLLISINIDLFDNYSELINYLTELENIINN
jgi:hypothetical protein